MICICDMHSLISVEQCLRCLLIDDFYADVCCCCNLVMFYGWRGCVMSVCGHRETFLVQNLY